MTGPEIKLNGFNSLFGADTTKRIVTLPLSELHQHPNLGVQVQDGPYIDELAESIRKNGLLEDVRAFPDPEGGYWIISGRHRCKAAEKAGLTEVSVVLDDNMTKETAEIAITDSNLQHKLGVMERAWTWRIKREAESRQGYRSDLHGALDKKKKQVSDRTIDRYVRLTYLIPELQVRTEAKGPMQLKVHTGEALSYLSEILQKVINENIEEYGKLPSLQIAEEWKEKSRVRQLTADDIDTFFIQEKNTPVKAVSFSLPQEEIAAIIPESYTKKQITALILELLHNWAEEDAERD